MGYGTIVTLGIKKILPKSKYIVNKYGYAERTMQSSLPRYLLGGAKLIGQGAKSTLMPAAIGFSGASLWHWANTNVQQTGIISEDTEERLKMQEDQLDWAKEKWELEGERYQEEYEDSLYQTGLIEAFDQNARSFQAQQQSAQMQFDAEMFNAKQNQLIQDRNMYLANQAFSAFTGGTNNFNINDKFAYAFILTELQNIYLENTNPDQFANEPTPYEMDYENNFVD